MRKTATVKLCSIEGCVGRVKGRGWCSVHYQRWRAHGNPLKQRRLYQEDTRKGIYQRKFLAELAVIKKELETILTDQAMIVEQLLEVKANQNNIGLLVRDWQDVRETLATLEPLIEYHQEKLAELGRFAQGFQFDGDQFVTRGRADD